MASKTLVFVRARRLAALLAILAAIGSCTRKPPFPPTDRSALAILSRLPALPVRVSPDGQYLVTKATLEHSFELQIVRLSDHRVISHYRSPESQFSITWKPDSSALLFAAPTGHDGLYRLFLWPWTKGSPHLIKCPPSRTAIPPLQWSPQQDYFLYLSGGTSSYGDLTLVHLEERTQSYKILLRRVPVLSNYAWSFDGNSLAAVRYDQPGSLVLLNPSSGSLRPVTAFPRNTVLRDVAWLPDNVHLMVTARRQQDPFFSLYRVDPDGSLLACSRSATGDLENIHLVSAHRIAIESHYGGRSEVYVQDCEGGPIQSFATSTDSYRISSVSKRGELVLTRSPETRPPQIELAVPPQPARLFPDAPSNPAWEIPAPVQVNIPSESGKSTVPAYLWRPAAAAHPPLILFLHGGPHAVEGTAWDRMTLLLIKRGFAVLKLNYTGSTEYGRSFESNDSLEKRVTDVISARNYAVRELAVPSDKVILWGTSYGALLATHVLARDQQWRAVLLTSTAASSRPPSVPALHIPITAFHGEEDSVSPPDVARNFLQQIFGPDVFHNPCNSWYLLPDEGHNFSRPASLAALVTTLSRIDNPARTHAFSGGA